MTRRPCALALAFLALAVPATAGAQAVDTSCELALVKVDPTIVNVAFPDSSASYWAVAYQAVPGTRLRVRGEYPHARYFSFNIYDPAGRPIDSLNDSQLAPDAGATNPFLPRGDRTARRRGYTLTVEFTARPETRAPNTIYAGQGQNGLPNTHGLFIYRLYVPDDGRGEFGGVGLPRVTLEPAAGGTSVTPADCRQVSLPRLPANDHIAGAPGLPQLERLPYPGHESPVWRRFVNIAVAYADGLLDAPGTKPAREAADALPLHGLAGRGGFYSNLDNDYIYAPISRGHGQVLVLRGKAPTFAHTRRGVAEMPFGRQVRYFSICQNDGYNTRYVSCVRDDELVLDDQGYFTVAVSTAAQRPAGATVECGVNWLPWGPNFEGVLIYRHMLPDAGFPHAIQAISAYGEEEQSLGEYYPHGVYHATPDAFDAEHRCGAGEGSASP